MVTRKDVAKYAGVSPATVSNVINNKDVVRDELKKRVWDAIEALGYRPNMVARSLKTKETLQIALISNDITNHYYAEVALGMEDEARKAGYVVCMINASEDSTYIDEIIRRQFDGIIMATDKISIESINSLASVNIPIVFVGNEGYKGLDKKVTEVYIDTYGGARELFEHLCKQGHKRIGFISARKLKDLNEPDYRLKAYLDVLEENYIHIDPSLIYFEDETLDYAYTAASKMLMRSDRPTAIFTGNDYQAIAVMAAVNKAAMDIPNDISIAGFDNLLMSRYYSPSLTTVDMPKYTLGGKAMNILLKKLKGEKVGNIVMKTELIIRNSTSSPG